MLIFPAMLIFMYALVRFPALREALFHPVKVVKNCAVDIYKYFKYKKYNEAPFGYIRCYCAKSGKAFGAGKTLMATHDIVELFERYDGKPVWCERRKKFVTQRINILSNVALATVPYVHFESLAQFVALSENIQRIDDENDTLTVTIALIDEASSQLNSRAFKSNFNAEFIQSLLTSRHFRASLLLTSQTFDMVDKLMRSCVSSVYVMNKIWRFQRYDIYDPRDMEKAGTETALQPMYRGCWFIENKAFENYDTYETVKTLQKAFESGDMLSDEEILTLRGEGSSDMDAVDKLNKKYMRRSKRMHR